MIATTKPLHLRTLDPEESKGTRRIGPTKVIKAINEVIENLSSNKFDWSEDTVKIRSYEQAE